METIEGIRTAGGYAIGVRHEQSTAPAHGGNTRYALSQRGWWQCQGCGHFWASESVRSAQGARTGRGVLWA